MRSRRKRNRRGEVKNEEQEEEKQKRRSTNFWDGLTYMSYRSAAWCALSGIPP
jgi:hypothetical protein